MVDFPKPLPSELTIKPRGLTLFEYRGVTHIIDHIGSGYYPNFPDWWEEVCHFGFHQRVEVNLPFERLDPNNSLYIMSHSRGLITSRRRLDDLYNRRYDGDPRLHYAHCPTENSTHNLQWDETDLNGPAGMCIGMLWHTLTKGEVVDEEERDFVVRRMPSFLYHGFQYTTHKLDFQPAFLAAFPVSMMQWLIYKGENGEHEDTAAKLDGAPDWIVQNISYMEMP
jgi:hypothetical protein